MAASLLRRLANAYAAGGMTGVTRAALGRIYERTDFIGAQRDLTLPPPQIRCSATFDLRRVDDDQLRRFQSMPYPFSRHYEYRFTYHMRRCYGAFVGGRIVALMWPLFQADNRLTVTRWRYLWPDEARISNAWVDPEYRGTGLIDDAYERLTHVITAGGFRYIYGFTWIGNHSSRRFQARLGYHEVTRVTRYAFKWQQEGRGLYLRQRVPRAPIAAVNPGGDLAIPDLLPPVPLRRT